MKYAAYVYQNRFESVLNDIARIGIKRERYDGAQDFLAADGTWQPLVEGGGSDGGILLPIAAIEAVEEAIRKFTGYRLKDAPTEAGVLREWLAVERARVDAVLKP